MRRLIKYLGITPILILSVVCASAQVPNISYNPSTNIFTSGTAITPLTPTNTGGTVPANTYSAVTTLSPTTGVLNNPQGLTTDGAGTIYEADNNADVIYMINASTGTTTLIAGRLSTTGETDNTTGTSARFTNPSGIVYDGAGYLYVTDNGGNKIRRISTTAPYAVVTIAGTGATSESDNTTGTSAKFNGPAGITYDGSAYLYVADNGGNKIRRVSTTAPYAVVTIAGTGTASESDNTTGTSAKFNGPAGIVYDGSAYLYVADNGGSTIRQISTTSPYAVTTFAGKSSTTGSTNGTGTAARFKTPWGITIDQFGNLYVADEGNNLVRMITTSGAVVTTLAGSGTRAELDGTGTSAEFYSPYAIVSDGAGNLYIGDDRTTNSTCRQITLTGYQISPTLPSGLSFDGTTGTISGTPSSTQSATTYTITAYNSSGSASTTISIACGTTIYWTGWISTSWNTSWNWSSFSVPTANDAVQIGVSNTFTNQPTISGNVTANSITIGNKTNLTLTITSSTLTVSGGITVNSGASPTITGSGSVYFQPEAVLTINGTLTNSLSGSFTLASDATGSASIGPLSSSTAFNGTLSVQRYFTGGSNTYRGYRLVSCPVYTGTANSNNIYGFDYIKASALVTSTTMAAGGFDVSTGGNNPTLYLFRQDQAVSNATFTSGNFWGITKINNSPSYNLYLNGGSTTYNVPVGNGFLFFFRGDRTTNLSQKYLSTTSAESVTFTATGTPNMGQITFKDWYTPTSPYLDDSSVTGNAGALGYNLAGNPYPSNIDWDTFQSSSTTTGIYGYGLDGAIYTLDPVSKNYGVYFANTGGVGTNNATNIISSGQGFFVKASGSNPQLIFNESAKTTSQVTGPNLLLGVPVNTANNQYLHLKLYKDSVNSDETMFRFNSEATTNYTEKLDAPYKAGFGAVSISSISNDHVNLAINVIPLPKLQPEIIALSVNANADGPYKITLKDIVSIPQLYDVWLMDKYTGDSVNMRQNRTYSFNIARRDTNTYGPHRFSLVLRQNAAYAYKLISFNATKATNARQVQTVWTTANEGNYTNFTVQKSTDNGTTFNVIGGLTATGAGNYSLTDNKPVNGQNIYRLQQQDVNGTITYSKPVSIFFTDLGNNIKGNLLSVFPNPVTSSINLAINAPTAGNASFDIKVINSSGLVVKETTSSQASWQGNMGYLQPGIYLIRVLNSKTDSVVGETKFIKL
ncbi:MAG: T9SS type A sorting domain-containing protein [Mucilaginibacter sp.]